MKTIYNAQGETKECDAVDAREHIATGRWFAEAPVPDSPATPLEASAPPLGALITDSLAAEDAAARSKRARK